MDEEEIQAPHILSLIGENKCDVCNLESSSNKSLTLSNNRLIGWKICDNIDCKNKVKSWVKKTTIKNFELRKIFGDEVNVLRNSGKMEKDWEIDGEAYLDKCEKWLIKVRKKNTRISKCLDLEIFRSWQ